MGQLMNCVAIFHVMYGFIAKRQKKQKNFISNFTNPVGAIKNDGEYIQARLLAKERPAENSVSVDKTLEDVFFVSFWREW